MNTRQKAKYWKKKYRELESLPVRPTIIVSDRKLETLSYSTVVSDEIYMLALDNPEVHRKIFGDVIDRLAAYVENYVDISVEKDFFNCGMRINGRLDVAIPFHDYHNIYNTHWDVMHDKRENNGGMSNDKRRG